MLDKNQLGLKWFIVKIQADFSFIPPYSQLDTDQLYYIYFASVVESTAD